MDHGIKIPELLRMVSVLKKGQGKLDCLIGEMFCICKRKPLLNTQADSICAKVLFYSTFFSTGTFNHD